MKKVLVAAAVLVGRPAPQLRRALHGLRSMGYVTRLTGQCIVGSSVTVSGCIT